VEKVMQLDYTFERRLELQKEEGISQGVIRGSIEAWQDVNLSEEDILARLQRKFQLDEATAEEYYKQYATKAVG
jgi:hypothetical protein